MTRYELRGRGASFATERAPGSSLPARLLGSGTMPLEPPHPMIPPAVEAIVLLRAAQAALVRAAEADPQGAAVTAALHEVGAVLVKLEAATLAPS